MRYFHLPEPRELQCDLDNQVAVKAFKAGVKLLKESNHYEVEKVSLRKSFTKGHYHGRVFLKESVSNHERITLQLLLGSDIVRELLSWGRYLNSDPHPTLFIESYPDKRDIGFSFGNLKCNCTIPRCEHLRKLQPSSAEFPALCTRR